MVVVNGERANSAAEVASLGLLADRTDAILVGKHGVVMGNGNPEVPLQESSALRAPSSRRLEPFAALALTAIFAPSHSVAAATVFVESFVGKMSLTSFAEFGRLIGIAEEIGRITLHQNLNFWCRGTAGCTVRAHFVGSLYERLSA
jgi:hypothetical protein